MRSPLRHLPSAVHVLVAAVANIVALPVSGQSSDIGPVTFRDSIVMRQLVYRAPCPVPVPRAWSLVDSTLGRPPRCSLVEVAARAVAQSSRASRQGGVGDPWNPLCVRVVVGENTGSTGLPGDWIVLFDLAVDRQAYVIIDRQTGNVGGVRLGNGPPLTTRSCMS